tara:strand:+ start:36 stop:221 length:186 start_codon:yes stop_codon:yes gene_type:complete
MSYTTKGEFDKLWDFMTEESIATEEECRLICHINGPSLESLESILQVRTGMIDLEHYLNNQ